MERNTKLFYLIVAILSFVFCFAFIQSMQFGNERIPFSIYINGKNLKRLNAYYSNNIYQKVPLKIVESTSNKYTLEVPINVYIRNLILTIDYNKSIEIHSIELKEKENKVTIKTKDFSTFFRNYNYRYDTKSKRFIQLDSSKNIYNPKLVITSVDISNFTNELYIKRLILKNSILYSITFSIFITFIYILFFKETLKFNYKKTIPVFIIAILSFFVYSKLNYKSTQKEVLSEKNFFDNINPHTQNNLVYNGNFEYDLQFWTFNSDSTQHKIINTNIGKALKISRANGDGGYFSLLYCGRPIYYHKDHNYQIKFKFKVIKGDKIPFKIGWWIKINNINYGSHALKVDTSYIIEDWYQGIATYRFTSDIKNPPCFLNCLNDHTSIMITDIEILDLDRNESQIDFIDQVIDSIIM